MTVAVSGSHGLIGSHVARALRRAGHRVMPMLRRASAEVGGDEIAWDPRGGVLEAQKLVGVQAVVHLAGEPLPGLWTDAKKRRIERSRAEGTRTVAQAIASLPRGDRPEVMVSASAIGFYGDTADQLVDERGPVGNDFLAAVCQQWEDAADAARQAGVRVVHPRLGVVLAPDGGALPAMARALRWCVGGRIGSGKQWVSWVAIDDAVGVIQAAIADDEVVGPVNAVAPRPVRQGEFVHTLIRVLHRPAALPMPAWLARLVMGEMADQMLLKSTRVRPAVLEAIGYAHHCPELEPALRAMLAED